MCYRFLKFFQVNFQNFHVLLHSNKHFEDAIFRNNLNNELLFSYFLMKGMEGNADQNNDNLITTGELHAYVQSNVMKHSLGSQTPELHGDHNKVLLRIN